ncbi:MAG: septum formation initiator family protein [Pacificimonas sp.]
MGLSTAFSDTFDVYVRPVAGPALCVIAVGFFGWHALAGDTGLLKLGEYKAKQEQLQVRAEQTAAVRDDLENKVDLMGSRAEPDYAEELVRRRLGLIRDDEIVVRLED